MTARIPGQGARRLGGARFVIREVLRDAEVSYLGPAIVSNQNILFSVRAQTLCAFAGQSASWMWKLVYFSLEAADWSRPYFRP